MTGTAATVAAAAPTVTFLVPCYRLAHLLGDCVRSILAQSYGDFEVIILDDCSPDNTPEVAASFGDPRVTHVRNDPNLGHLRNYNRGIGMARGKFIWLISADDRLRSEFALEKYMQAMAGHANVGFAFCAGVTLRNGVEEGVVEWARLDRPGGIIGGREFLKRLLQSNCVLASSGMVRRECYERLGAFPLDLPFAGDWYLWCLFALHYDVAYFSEPMVNYREHGVSMTDALIDEDALKLCRDDLAVRWRMKAHLEAAGDRDLADHCLDQIVGYYIQSLTSQRWRGVRYRMGLGEFEDSLQRHAGDQQLLGVVRRRVLTGIADRLHLDPELRQEPDLYRLAVEHSPSNLKLRLKYLLVNSGMLGRLAAQAGAGIRRAVRSRSQKSTDRRIEAQGRASH